MAVVIADVGGSSATRSLAENLACRLRRVGVVVVTCGRATSGAQGNRPVSGAIRRVFEMGGGRPILVLFGDESRQRRLVWGLTLAGLLPRVRLVVHAGAAKVPYEPSLADVFARAAVVVTESELGAQAVRQCCAEAGEPPPQLVVLPPALPPGTSVRGPTAADRRARRQACMDVADDDAAVVGCWTGDESDEVVPLALRIFQLFARGHYLRCDDCGHVTPWSEDGYLRPVPCDRCARCGSPSGVVGRARDDTRLVFIGEPQREDGLWRSGTIGSHLELEDRVVHEPMPASPHDLGQLWGCVDVHVQPHVLADVPPSIRASCVLGVPIVATKYGAVAERLTGAANLVPPRMVMDHSDGHRIALMDPGSALLELCRLADDRAARRLASARLRDRSRRWEARSWLDRWVELLDVGIAS